MSEERDSYHHGNLREALVRAAQALVEANGVGGLSLRGVAREAGVSQAAPYHHFPNKESLLAEVATRGFQALRAGLAAAMEAPGDPEARMLAAGRAYVGFALANPSVYRLMFGPEICVRDDQHAALQTCSMESLGLLIHAIAEGQAAGAFAGDDPLTTSLGVWSAVHGLASLLLDGVPARKHANGLVFTPEQMIDGTLQLVLVGLRPR